MSDSPSRIVAVSAAQASRWVGTPEVTGMTYHHGDLRVNLQFPDASEAVVVFDRPRGFRMLDEGDLLEFWDPASRVDGWLWRIDAGGWFDLEGSRPGFLADRADGLVEYLVVGTNDCVSVLAAVVPRVDPQRSIGEST